MAPFQELMLLSQNGAIRNTTPRSTQSNPVTHLSKQSGPRAHCTAPGDKLEMRCAHMDPIRTMAGAHGLGAVARQLDPRVPTHNTQRAAYNPRPRPPGPLGIIARPSMCSAPVGWRCWGSVVGLGWDPPVKTMVFGLHPSPIRP